LHSEDFGVTLLEKILGSMDSPQEKVDIHTHVRQWNDKHIGFEVLQLSQLDHQLENQFHSMVKFDDSNSLGLQSHLFLDQEQPHEGR
jgi:hypothetical protein